MTRRRAAAILGCLSTPVMHRRAAAQAPADWRLSKGVEWPEFQRRFEALGTTGALTMLDALRGGRLFVNGERATADAPPGGTFDIAALLIALQTGAAKDIEEEKFAAAGPSQQAEGGPCVGEVSLRDAFRHSCAPAWREIARRVGTDAFREWLTRLDYGNATPGPSPDSFWLDGDLRISPEGQTKFLRRLVIKSLPVSPRAAALTEDAMFIERIGDASVHGKAGVAGDGASMIGWWVGYAQRGEDVVTLALRIDGARREQEAKLYDLAKAAFAGVGMI